MQATDELFDKLPRLPSIPRVVQELIHTLDNPDADLHALIAEVKHDQALSLRVLRLANSSYYGVSRKIGAIDDAVALIGLNALRTLVITSGITWTFHEVPGVPLQPFWRHAMLTAMVARSLARNAQINGEYAYTAGLIHRVGELLIALALPDKAGALSHALHDGPVATLIAAERELLGLDHCEVGAEQARLWNFPPLIRNAVRWYPDPEHPEGGAHAGVVSLASQIAWGITHQQPEEATIAALPLPLCRQLGLAQLNWPEQFTRFRAFADEAAAIA